MGVNLGSTLPDFASMFRDYHEQDVTVKGIDPDVDAGIAFHLRTDAVYDGRSEKPQMTTLLGDALLERGLSRGAARLTSAFLADLMLDGALLGEQDPRRAFMQLRHYIIRETSALDNDSFDSAFANSVKTYFGRGLPRHYQDPLRMATIAQERLVRRATTEAQVQKYTFPEDKVPEVAKVIKVNTKPIWDLGLNALDATVHLLEIEETNGHLF